LKITRKEIGATAVGSIGSAGLYALFPLLPPFSYMIAMACPLPIAHLAWRNSTRLAALAVAFATAALAIGLGPAFAVQYLIPFGAGGVLVGSGVRLEWAPEKIVGALAGIGIGAFVAFLGYQAMQTGVSPMQYMERMAAEEMAPFRKIIAEEKLDPQSLLALETGLNDAQKLMGRAALGIVAGFCILAGWANALWLRQGILRQAKPVPSWAGWKAPEYWIWGLIAAGTLTAIGDETWSAVGLNLLIPMGLVYALQGLAIVEYLLRAGSASRLIRGIVYILVFMQLEITAPILAIAGAFDQWIDFRGRWAPPADSTGADETENSFRNEGGNS
jgi:hypothetical protein